MAGLIYPVLGIIAMGGLAASIANPQHIGWWMFPSLILGFLLFYDMVTIPAQIREMKRSKKEQIMRSIVRDSN